MSAVRSAAAFKRHTTLTLPSGLQVEARRPNMQLLVFNAPKGVIPLPILAGLVANLNGKPAERHEMTGDDLPNMGEFIKLVVTAAMVWPQIVDAPDYEAGQIAIEDLEDEDLNVVFRWARGGERGEQAAAERFPAQPDAGVSAGQDGAPLRAEAEPLAEAV